MPETPTIAGTLLVALIGALVVHHVHRLNAFRAASVKYRASVLDTLSSVYPKPAKWPENVDGFCRNVFPTLQSAVAEFRPFVPWYKRRAFDRAWSEYRCSTGREVDVQCYHHYMGFSDQPDPKVTFRKNVDALLSYATQP